jgi:hypothetical protein
MIHIAFSLFNNSISNESANYWSGDKMILVPEYIYPTNQLIAPYFVGVLCAPTCFSCHRLHNGDSVSQFTCFFLTTHNSHVEHSLTRSCTSTCTVVVSWGHERSIYIKLADIYYSPRVHTFYKELNPPYLFGLSATSQYLFSLWTQTRHNQPASSIFLLEHIITNHYVKTSNRSRNICNGPLTPVTWTHICNRCYLAPL